MDGTRLPCFSDEVSSTVSVMKLSGELLSASPAPPGAGRASESSSSWMGDDGDRRVLSGDLFRGLPFCRLLSTIRSIPASGQLACDRPSETPEYVISS